MAEFKKRKEEKKRKKMYYNSVKKPEDVSLDRTFEERSATKTPKRLDRNLKRFRLPSDLLCPEGTVIRTETEPVYTGTVTIVENCRVLDFSSLPDGEYKLSIPDDKSNNKIFTLKEVSESLGTIGNEVKYPIKPVFMKHKLPNKPKLEDFVVTVRGPKTADSMTEISAVVLHSADLGFYVSFTPWLRGLYRIRVRYISDTILYAAVPVEDGKILKQLIEDRVFQSSDSRYQFMFPPIFTTRLKKLSYTSRDFVVAYTNEKNWKEKYWNSYCF
jgi:hypothetical protein